MNDNEAFQQSRLTRRKFLTRTAVASGLAVGAYLAPQLVPLGRVSALDPARAMAVSPAPTTELLATETLVVPWDVSGGVPTTNEYSGRVKLAISGFVSATPPQLSDAFYRLIDVGTGEPVVPPISECDGAGGSEFLAYSLGGDTRRLEGSGRGLRDAIVYVEGVGAVSPPYCPPFNESGYYCVIIDLGAFSGRFHLGTGDGAVGDNSGSLTITLTQV